MADFELVVGAVQKALATGQIGTPVGVRIVEHSSADHGQIESTSARALSAAISWLGGKPTRLTAGGSVRDGQITTLALLDGGQTAVVSAGACGVGLPLRCILVWGSHGILCWEGDEIPMRLGTGDPMIKLSEEARQWLGPIREALKSTPKTAVDPSGVKIHPAKAPPPQPPPYGVLLVAGDHTHQPGYAKMLADDPRCKLVGLTDEEGVSPRRRELNRQLAETLNVPLLPDLQAALARSDVHVVSICAEPIRRGRIAVLAAKAGKHLYMDKPLAGSLSDADNIAAAVREARVAGHMFSMVHSDVAGRVRALVESGELGELNAIHFDLCFAKGHTGSAKLGRPRQESSVPDRFELADSKRELSNVGVYPLVMLLTLVNRPVQSVSATTGNYFFAQHQQNNMEDFGQMLLQLDGGLVATFSVGRTGWCSSPGGGLNRTCLIGTKGCALVDTHRPRVEVWADAEPWRPPSTNPADPMKMWVSPPHSPFEPQPKQAWITPPVPGWSDPTYFLDCVEQGRDSMVSAEVARAATEILMGAYRSAASGQRVGLPLPRA